MVKIKYLDINEVLDTIDKRFGYIFEEKDEKDHLISRETWTKYVREFKEENIFNDKMMKSSRRYTRYRKDFVKEVIDYREDLLRSQYNRKTTIDHEKIAIFTSIANATGGQISEDIYEARIPIIEYEKRQRNKETDRVPNITNDEIEKLSKNLLEIVINDLIDMEKVNYDVYESIINGSLHYGLSYPLEAVGEQDGQTLGFKRDSKNYLKESIIRQLIILPKYKMTFL